MKNLSLILKILVCIALFQCSDLKAQDTVRVRPFGSTVGKLMQEKLNIHVPDNGDGTYSNPVMPNSHWSDPSLLRVGDDFYCMSSSIEHSPLMQVLHSKDLVNWDVIGSVIRFWPEDLPPVYNWSPRLCYVNKKFRVMGHMSLQTLCVWESDKPEGPYQRVFHNFTNMAWEWAPTIFEEKDGRKYMYAGTWIQEVDERALSFVGERINTVKGTLLENASIIKKGEYYYWFMAQNGDRPFGTTTNNGKTSVWRSKKITGPYEGDIDVILGSNRFQCPNSGSAVQGPDDKWYYAYNAVDITKQMMCRQMLLEKLEWNSQGWPYVIGNYRPSIVNTKPINNFKPTYFPDLNDEFSNTELEGISEGILGRKWLFKAEKNNAWNLEYKKGWMRLNCLYPSMNDLSVSNFMCQRPTGAYYTIETRMIYKPMHLFQQAGLAVKELCSGNGASIGLVADWLNDTDTSYSVVVSHGLTEGWREVSREHINFPNENKMKDIYLKMEVNNIQIKCFYSFDGKSWKSFGKSWGYFMETTPWRSYWSTFYPGIFAGSTMPGPNGAFALFDYFKHENFDR